GKLTVDTLTTNHELILADLLNHIHTRKGERVERPEFGTSIHDMILDLPPIDAEKVVRNELTRVVNSDPRVELVNISVAAREHDISAEIVVKFLEDDLTAKLVTTFIADL
ncbi:MAG: hypothetical protein D6698_06400, partial [Gammaproteobacteria bacterium]